MNQKKGSSERRSTRPQAADNWQRQHPNMLYQLSWCSVRTKSPTNRRSARRQSNGQRPLIPHSTSVSLSRTRFGRKCLRTSKPCWQCDRQSVIMVSLCSIKTHPPRLVRSSLFLHDASLRCAFCCSNVAPSSRGRGASSSHNPNSTRVGPRCPVKFPWNQFRASISRRVLYAVLSSKLKGLKPNMPSV